MLASGGRRYIGMKRSERSVRKKPTIKSWNGEPRIWVVKYDVIIPSKMEFVPTKKVHGNIMYYKVYCAIDRNTVSKH